MQHRQLSLAHYVRRRNGVALGTPGALTNMLRRSLGANSITQFWQFWNPVFGYYLGRYVFRPARSIGLSYSWATLITFCVSGAIHDLATGLVRQQFVFVCTPWFMLMGIGLLISRSMNMNLKSMRWGSKAMVHLTYVSVCLLIVQLIKHTL